MRALWQASSLATPEKCIESGLSSADAPAFSQVLPPPNVTGRLHNGHAVMLAIQDALTRFHRMRGDRTLWLPGTDHAAIATQARVEKSLLEEEGKSRHDIGRPALLERAETFAQESQATIIEQVDRMGCIRRLDARRLHAR